MLLGFPASVKQSDKDAVHIQSVQGFIDRRVDTGEPITPEFARLCIMHLSEHDKAMMMKKDPATARGARTGGAAGRIFDHDRHDGSAAERAAVPAGKCGRSRCSANARGPSCALAIDSCTGCRP